MLSSPRVFYRLVRVLNLEALRQYACTCMSAPTLIGRVGVDGAGTLLCR